MITRMDKHEHTLSGLDIRSRAEAYIDASLDGVAVSPGDREVAVRKVVAWTEKLLAAIPRRCCQCGREGTRGYKVIPQAVHEPTGAVVGPFVVCASDAACRRRWPKNEPMVD